MFRGQYLLSIALAVFFICAFVSAGNQRIKWEYVQTGNCTSPNTKMSIYIDRARVKNLKECEDRCSFLSKCKSVSYRPPRLSKCQLYKNITGAKATNLIPKKGWVYTEKNADGGSSKSCTNMAYRYCNPHVKRIYGTETFFEKGGAWSWGGQDTGINSSLFYYMSSYSNERTLYTYPSYQDAKQSRVYKTQSLPTTCDGSQHIMRNARLFCRPYNNRQIKVFNVVDNTLIKTIKTLEQKVDGWDVGYSSQCEYDFGLRSSYDFLSDESDIYILWGRNNDGCKVSISRLNLQTLEIDRHWHLQFYRNYIGNSFMRCGRVFMGEHYNSAVNRIRYIWDMRTGNTTSVYNTERNMPDLFYFNNWQGYRNNWHYNPANGYVYGTHHNAWERQKLYVEPEGKHNIWVNY